MAVLLLIGVYIPHLGKKVFGAYSWIHFGPVGFEPAEFAKLAYILGMTWLLCVRENKIHHLSTVLIALGITLVPFLLVLKQPALGTAAVFFPVCFAMLFAAGARLHYILIRALAGHERDHLHLLLDPCLGPAGAVPETVPGEPHQDFLRPEPRSEGFRVADRPVAHRHRFRRDERPGLHAGHRGGVGYLPKNTSYNDLIFPVAAEEFGFRGAAALITGEGIVLLWCLWVAARARDKVGALVAVGVMAMLFTHIFVNIGMTIHLVPITGIPLPFISYGGTFVVACLAAMAWCRVFGCIAKTSSGYEDVPLRFAQPSFPPPSAGKHDL